MTYRRSPIDHSERVTVELHQRTVSTFRQMMGMSQQELASKVGVTQSYIQKLETGKRKVPSAEMANLIGDALNVNFILVYRNLS